MDDLLREIRRAFEGQLQRPSLLAMSSKLQEQFEPKLQSSNICMLPSYIHTLPSGEETGTYLALDVGGSTFRVAAVQLYGRNNGQKKSMDILEIKSFRIGNLVKALEGHAFFGWMADRIVEVLESPVLRQAHGSKTVVMGLAWSFPIE